MLHEIILRTGISKLEFNWNFKIIGKLMEGFTFQKPTLMGTLEFSGMPGEMVG